MKEFVPEGLSVEGTTIIDDETGAKAKDFILRYRSLSDGADVAVSIAPKSYVYDGKEKETCGYGFLWRKDSDRRKKLLMCICG